MRAKTGLLGLAVAGLAVGLLAWNGGVRADVAPVPVAKHHHHHIHGKIVSVDGTSVTIKVHHHHKNGVTTTTPATETKTFKITGQTTVQKVSETGTKTAGALTDLTAGKRVVISAHKGVAEVITMGHHHKKKLPAA